MALGNGTPFTNDPAGVMVIANDQLTTPPRVQSSGGMDYPTANPTGTGTVGKGYQGVAPAGNTSNGVGFAGSREDAQTTGTRVPVAATGTSLPQSGDIPKSR